MASSSCGPVPAIVRVVITNGGAHRSDWPVSRSPADAGIGSPRSSTGSTDGDATRLVSTISSRPPPAATKSVGTAGDVAAAEPHRLQAPALRQTARDDEQRPMVERDELERQVVFHDGLRAIVEPQAALARRPCLDGHPKVSRRGPVETDGPGDRDGFRQAIATVAVSSTARSASASPAWRSLPGRLSLRPSFRQ